MKSSVTLHLEPLEQYAKELSGDEFGYFVAAEVHKQYTPAMPARTKAYSTNIDFSIPWQYTHLQDYSVWVYNLNNNYRKEINPFAMSEYIEGFASVALPKVNQSIANYIEHVILGD